MYLYVVFPIEQHPSFDLFQIKTLVNCSNICDSSLDFYESNFGSTLILPFISFHHWWVLARSSFCFIFPPSASIWNNASMLGSWHLSIFKKIHQIWPTLANLDSHHPHLMKMILPGFFLIVVQKSKLTYVWELHFWLMLPTHDHLVPFFYASLQVQNQPKLLILYIFIRIKMNFFIWLEEFRVKSLFQTCYTPSASWF